MCYAIPAKLIDIQGNIGTIDYYGEKRKILMDLDTVKVGDYVYAQGGVLISKVEESEAKEILDTWKEIFFELKKTDEALSKIKEDQLSENALAILQKVNLKKSLKKAEIIELLKLTDTNELSVLYEIANNVRQREHGNASCVHGIIEFSNMCQQNCLYCGIRKDKSIQRYRMTPEEIIQAAKVAVEQYGFKALVLQSGEDLWYTDAILENIVKTIRQMGVLVFLSIGSRSVETYQRLYDAGARAALLRFETSNPGIYEKIRPGTTLKDRVELIQELNKIGYVLATGFMLGLPGETLEDVANNILLTKSLNPDMFSFGPLIPTVGTPLENHPKVDKDYVLKTIAVTRFVASQSNILVTTALETLDINAKREALLAGANSMMINATPPEYQKLYSIYDGKADKNKKFADSIQETVDLLYSLGRAPTDIGK